MSTSTPPNQEPDSDHSSGHGGGHSEGRSRGARLLLVGALLLGLLASCGGAVGGLTMAMVAGSGGGGADCPTTTDGTPTTGGATAGGSIEAQQLTNAKIIDSVATKLGLPGRASLIAIVAATGESDLINIGHGDAAGPDSAGLFQQRPSQGWGTRAQVMDPVHATTSFLEGPQHNGTGGVVSITGWQQAPISAVIHLVQHNADPNHYTAYITRAQQIAAKAGIDFTRLGTQGTAQQAQAAAGADNGSGDGSGATDMCSAMGQLTTTEKLQIGTGPCPLDRPGQKVTCNAAIAYEQAQMTSPTQSWYRQCLHLVSVAYGNLYAGYATAYLAGVAVEHAGLMQPATTNYKAIPRGAVLFYNGYPTGNAAGHVAMSIGNGMAMSNDVAGNGKVGIVPISYFETTWREQFMGWAPPVRP